MVAALEQLYIVRYRTQCRSAVWSVLGTYFWKFTDSTPKETVLFPLHTPLANDLRSSWPQVGDEIAAVDKAAAECATATETVRGLSDNTSKETQKVLSPHTPLADDLIGSGWPPSRSGDSCPSA